MLLSEPSPELLWLLQDDFQLEQSTLLVSLFLCNPMLSKGEIKEQIQAIYNALQQKLEPWTKYYIWDTSPPSFDMICDEARNHCYIYGQLCFGDTFNDCWLLVHLLYELSKNYPDLYIRLYDNDGEVLLIEGYEALPEWIAPENAANRDWINYGRVLIIPEEYYRQRGLRLEEALAFLDRAAYRCTQIVEMNEIIEKKLAEFPKRALEGQCELDLKLPRVIAGLVIKSEDKSLLNRLVLAQGKADIEGVEKKTPFCTDDALVDLKIRSTVMCFLFIDFFLNAMQTSDSFPIGAGKLVTAVLHQHATENDLDLSFNPSDDQILEFNNRGDVLQNELIRLMKIDHCIEPKLEFDEPGNAEDLCDGESLTSKLKEFFEDTDAGMEGVNNISKHDRTQGISKGSEASESDDEDKKAEEFFRKQKIDIDEDDFFEFFAKEALKLSDDEIQKFSSIRLDENNQGQVDDEGGAEYDSEEEREILENVSANDLQPLQDVIKMLKVGGADGPAATFLQNLGSK